MTVLEVLDGVVLAVETRFPDLMVYRNLQEQKYQRPSFFVVNTGHTMTIDTVSGVLCKGTFRITGTVPLDTFGNGDLAQLVALEGQVMGLFAPQFLEIDAAGDKRAVVVDALSAQAGTEFCEVTVTLRWYENLLDFVPQDTMPVMEILNLEENLHEST